MLSISVLGTIYTEYKVQSAEFELWSVEQVHADAVTGRWRDKKIVMGNKNCLKPITDRLLQNKICIKSDDLVAFQVTTFSSFLRPFL